MALRLNLGCGDKKISGYVNVDKFGDPDLRFDLETFPWPWEDNSVERINLIHTLEHLGEAMDTYFKIIQELYRISQNGTRIDIVVPHPRHDDFIADPSHVRPITVDGLALFSKKHNENVRKHNYSNSLLGESLNVDFDIVSVKYVLDDAWQRQAASGLSQEALEEASKRYNNVIQQIEIGLRVIKS